MWKPFTIAALVAFAVISTGAELLDPTRLCSNLVVGFGIFLLMPVFMAGALLAVCLPLCAFVLTCGLLSMQRNSGAGELVGEILALPRAVVPGYVRALRTVHSPALWGGVLGTFLATATLVARLAAAAPFQA